MNKHSTHRLGNSSSSKPKSFSQRAIPITHIPHPQQCPAIATLSIPSMPSGIRRSHRNIPPDSVVLQIWDMYTLHSSKDEGDAAKWDTL